MPCRNSKEQYGGVSKFFHWILFILVVGMLIFGACLDFFPKTAKGDAYMVHKSIGLIIFVLAALRILWVLTNPKPKLPANTPFFEKFLAHSMHCLLYLIVFAMPLSGWIMSTAAGRSPNFFGWFVLNFPISQSKAVAGAFNDVHFILAWTITGLIILHILAALQHHFIRKNNLLKRMLPFTVDS